MQLISRDTSIYIFQQDYILVTILSMNGVSDFVVGPRKQTFVLLLPGNLVDVCISTCRIFFLIPMEADLSICSSSVGWNSKPRRPDQVSLA